VRFYRTSPFPFTPSGVHSARRTSTLPPTLTSAQPPTRVWEVVRTAAAPPSILVKCGVMVLRVVVCGVVLVVSCRVSCGVWCWGYACGRVWCCSCRVVCCVVLFLLCACMCDLFLCSHHQAFTVRSSSRAWRVFNCTPVSVHTIRRSQCAARVNP